MNISLTDPRLTAIEVIPDVVVAVPGPVPVVLKPAPVSSLSFRRSGNLAIFTVGALPSGTPIEVQVPIINDQLVFFPERCANQRDVMAALGLG